MRIVPMCSALYLLCFLCRQNIGNAKTYHMTTSLGISMETYQFALTVFFFGYSTFDIPCNLMMRKLGPKIWLPTITVMSGIVTACMGLVQSGGALIAVRLLLGIVECGLFPGVATMITMWYVKKEAQFRQALFFCAASMAGAFAGLLAIGLAKMDGTGGYEGWRWILIIEGILTVVVACGAFFVVQNSPATASFLNDRDRLIITHRLRNDEYGLSDNIYEDTPEKQKDDEYIHEKLELFRIDFSHSKSKLLKLVFGKWHIYAHIMVFYGISAPLYSISLCLPSILNQLPIGDTPTMANLLTIPIYVTACIISLVQAFMSDRTGKRAPFIFTSYIVMFVGFLISLVRPANLPGLAYAGVFIAACGIYPAFPGMITWCSNNIGGGDKVRAISMAFHIGMGSFGGAMGANFYSNKTKGSDGLYRVGHALNLAFVCAGLICVLLLSWSYRTVNKKREAQRVILKAKFEEEIAEKKRSWEAGERTVGGEKKEEEQSRTGQAPVVDADEEPKDWETKERYLRREFELKREMDLVEHGGESVWFVYTL
ncbi:major facilitator superfamily domain-containing protein [Peziza echinospora]|nr:major facilitator superfamily domain-containing protein [Peziza echinospora]